MFFVFVSKAEVSDQNFVNEGTRGENGSSKKMKTVVSGSSPSSSTDQVNFSHQFSLISECDEFIDLKVSSCSLVL